MTYAVSADMVSRFGELEIIQLTDHTGAGVIDQDVLALALADADAEINGYIGSKYALPLVSVPPILVGYASDITRYKLYDDAAPEQVRRRYEDAIKFLNYVGQGKLLLIQPDGAAVTVNNSASITSRHRVFNGDGQGGF